MRIPLYDGEWSVSPDFSNTSSNTDREDALEKTVYEAAVEIKDTNGLHMQPAMRFVDLANQFDCDITISNGKDTVDGKSIMQVTMLAAVRGTKLTIRTEGTDAEKAINALREFVEEQISDGKGQGKRENR